MIQKSNKLGVNPNGQVNMSPEYKNIIQKADVWGSLKHLSRGSLATSAMLIALSGIFAFSSSNPSYGSFSESVSRETYRFSSPSSTEASTCNSLLKSPSRTLSPFAFDGTQRPVGKVAALGLVYGVRFALEPARNHHISVPKLFKSNGKALSVAAYRDCLKRQTLNLQRQEFITGQAV